MTANASRRGLLGVLAVLPLAAVPAVAVGAVSPDAGLIALCERIVVVDRAQNDLLDIDPGACDYGPNYRRFWSLEDEMMGLFRRLVVSEYPTTLAGIRALAKVAMRYVYPNLDGDVQPSDFAEWVKLRLLLAVSGHDGELLLPPYFPPDDWDRAELERDADWGSSERVAACAAECQATLEAADPVRVAAARDPQESLRLMRVMLNAGWTVAKENADHAGHVITLDDLRDAGFPIPAEMTA